MKNPQAIRNDTSSIHKNVSETRGSRSKLSKQKNLNSQSGPNINTLLNSIGPHASDHSNAPHTNLNDLYNTQKIGSYAENAVSYKNYQT